MKKLSLLAAGAALVTSAMVSSTASADISYNVGFTSEYFFRGISQHDASLSAGIDYEDDSGFYVGAWTADVGDGLEVDGYFGYGAELDSGLSYSVGFTGYFYTGDFDDTYKEINLGLGYGMASLEYSFGEWDGFGNSVDYDFLALTIEQSGFYGTVGTFGLGLHGDGDGEYLELGYGFNISGIDIGIAGIFNDDVLAGGESDQTAVVSIGYGF